MTDLLLRHSGLVDVRTAGWLAIVTLALDSCGFGAPTVQQGTPELPYHAIPVDTEGGYFGGLAWPSGGWLFVGYLSGSVSSHPQVRRLRPDGSGFQAVSLPDNPACTRTYYGGFGILHDGRLAIVQTCQLPTGSSPSASYAVIAYDIRSGGVAPIFPLQTMIHPGGVSFNATDDRAVTAQGGNICGTIAYLTRDGAAPIPATISDGDRRWRLDEDFHHDPAQDCAGTGRVDGPDWSSDGKQIAFLGFPQAIGESGPDRLDSPGNIYLLDPATLRARVLVRDVKYPAGVAWSPDGHWLALSASELPGHGQGTWLLSVRSGTFVRVSNRPMTEVVWSPDGKQLLGLWDNGKALYPPQTELDIFDVRSVTTG